MATQKLGTLEVELVANAKSLRAGLNSAGRAVARYAALAGAAMAAFGAHAVQSAARAQEVTSKFGVVFSNVSANAQAAAKELRDSYDLSTTASEELLSGTADLLAGFGFTQEAALETSLQVQKLAADLASFQNLQGGAAEASAALTSGLLGQRRAMQRLGIVVNEQTPEWKNMLAQVERTTGTTGSQAKALATLRLALQQSKNASGDYARTQGSLANQQRALKADVEDLVDVVGTELIPVAQAAVKAARDMAAAFSVNDFAKLRELIEGVKDRIAAVATGFKTIANGAAALVASVGFALAKLNAYAQEASGFAESAAKMHAHAEVLKLAAQDAASALTAEGIEKTYIAIRQSMSAAKEDAKKQTGEAKAQTKELEQQKRIREGIAMQFNRSLFRFDGASRSIAGGASKATAAAAGAYVPETGMFAPSAGQAEALAELARLRARGVDSEGIRRRAANANLNAAGGLLDPGGTGVGLSVGDGTFERRSEEQGEVVRLLQQLVELGRQNKPGLK